MITTAAMDDVPWLGIVGQDNHPLTVGTTDLFQRNGDEMVSLSPQPEGKPGSERTVNDVAWLSSLGKVEFSAAFRASDGGHLIL